MMFLGIVIIRTESTEYVLYVPRNAGQTHLHIAHICGCIKRLGSRSDYSPTFWVARPKRLRNTDLRDRI